MAQLVRTPTSKVDKMEMLIFCNLVIGFDDPIVNLDH